MATTTLILYITHFLLQTATSVSPDPLISYNRRNYCNYAYLLSSSTLRYFGRRWWLYICSYTFFAGTTFFSAHMLFKGQRFTFNNIRYSQSSLRCRTFLEILPNKLITKERNLSCCLLYFSDFPWHVLLSPNLHLICL